MILEGYVASERAEKLRPDTADGTPPEMTYRQTKGRERRCGPPQMLLVLALLPALIFGPALGGMAAWLHSHGPSGGHLHLLALETDHDLGARQEWHDAQHRHDHQDDTHHEEEPTPVGLLIELPQVIGTAPRVTALSSATWFPLPAFVPSVRSTLVLVESTYRPDLRRSGWPPQRAKRSGVAALLRSSHAILI